MTKTRRAPDATKLFAAACALSALCLFGAPDARAQWTTGTDIGNTNPGNVGVGTTSPPQTLTVSRSAADTSPLQWNSAPTLLLRNTSATANNYSGIVFGNSASTTYFTSGIAGVNEDHTTTPSGRLVFFTKGGGAWAERMRITSGGWVGIGTSSPAAPLHVTGPPGQAGYMMVSGAGNATINFMDTAGPVDAKQYQWRSEGGVFRISLVNDAQNNLVRQNILVAHSSGNVGIGTASPGGQLSVSGSSAAGGSVEAHVVNGTATGYQSLRLGTDASAASNLYLNAFNASWATSGSSIADSGSVFGAGGGGLSLGAVNASGVVRLYTGGAGAANERMRIDAAGNVGIGTTPGASYKLDVNGNARITGAISTTGAIHAGGAITGATVNATYQDVAEWVPSTQKLGAGTVVVLDAERSNHVLASTTSYDTKVAGVISERPGISLGEGGEGRALVATTGRVKVKVDATRAAVKVGDLLVTSDVEGMAMKSVPVDLGGTQIHRPGTIIGKALEPLEKGTGEILVLLSLQ
jgi:hypothetical protein